MTLRQLKFMAEMPPGGRGKRTCLAWRLSSLFRPLCLRLVPVSPSAPTPSGTGGRRLQLRAAASRWDFLTNTTPGRSCPRAGRPGRSLSLLPLQVQGAWAVTRGEGRGTVHVSPTSFHELAAEGIPRFPSETERPRGAGHREFPRVSAAPQIRSVKRRSLRPPAPAYALCPQPDRLACTPSSRGGVGWLGGRHPPRRSPKPQSRTNGRKTARPEAKFAGKPRDQRFCLEHPREQSLWRDTCHLPRVLPGDPFRSAAPEQGARACGPDCVLRVGGRRVAPSRAGPGLLGSRSRLAPSQQRFPLCPPPSPPPLGPPFSAGAG